MFHEILLRQVEGSQKYSFKEWQALPFGRRFELACSGQLEAFDEHGGQIDISGLMRELSFAKPKKRGYFPLYSKTPRTLRIGIVEDSEVDRLWITSRLSKLGLDLEIHEARNGKEGLELMSTDAFLQDALVLVDVNMPYLTGFEFLRKLKLKENGTRNHFFMMSSSSSEIDRQMAFYLGAQGFLSKTHLLDHEPVIGDLVRACIRFQAPSE